jgi:hypothetical protein
MPTKIVRELPRPTECKRIQAYIAKLEKTCDSIQKNTDDGAKASTECFFMVQTLKIAIHEKYGC